MYDLHPQRRCEVIVRTLPHNLTRAPAILLRIIRRNGNQLALGVKHAHGAIRARCRRHARQQVGRGHGLTPPQQDAALRGDGQGREMCQRGARCNQERAPRAAGRVVLQVVQRGCGGEEETTGPRADEAGEVGTAAQRRSQVAGERADIRPRTARDLQREVRRLPSSGRLRRSIRTCRAGSSTAAPRRARS